MNLLTLFLFLPSFVKKSLKIINLQCLKLAPFPNEVHKNKQKNCFFSDVVLFFFK